MGFFIGWLIVLAFEVLFIYLCVADPSNWLSILIAIVNGVFFIGMTNALIHPKEIKKETSSSSSISTNKNQSASTSNYEKQSASTANYANVVHIKVVGVTVGKAGAFSLDSPRQNRIQQLKSGDKIILKHELDNRYDKSAICVWNAEGKMLGYIPKKSNVRILEELTKNNVEKAEVKAVVGGYGNGKAYGLDISIFLKNAAANLPKDNTSKVPPISSTSSTARSYLVDYDLPDPREYLDIEIPTREDLSYGNDYDLFGPGDVDSNDASNELVDYDGYDPGDY